VAAPAPMNLAAESMSLDTADVWKLRAGNYKQKHNSFLSHCFIDFYLLKDACSF
jgi:hypothetical protein